MILVLALISIIYGALLAVGQRDIKRLIAYASISHFGFIILGIFAMTSQGQSGATLYMVNHGISTAALMLVAGFLISPARLAAHRRLRRGAEGGPGARRHLPDRRPGDPVAARASRPSSASSWSWSARSARYPVVGIIATFGIVLAALYVLVLYQRTMTGPVKAEVAGHAGPQGP